MLDEPRRTDRQASAPAATTLRRTRYLPSRTALVTISVIIVALDQASKAAIRTALSPFDSVAVVPGFLNLTFVRNTGAAFGVLNAVDLPFKPAIMTVIAAGALVAIAIYSTHATTQYFLSQTGLALVMGGAVGNLVDRLMLGYVVDFVDVYWGTWHFWAFNVADASITVGATLLILDMVWVNRHVSETA